QSSSEALRAFHAIAAPRLPPVVDDFYAALAREPGALAAVPGGATQLPRLAATLREWLRTLLQGPHDEAYFRGRARIGQAHVRIDLSQSYMFVGMSRLRVALVRLACEALAHDPTALSRTITALDQLLDLELAIMFETYRED